jgi:hypothetical protein
VEEASWLPVGRSATKQLGVTKKLTDIISRIQRGIKKTYIGCGILDRVEWLHWLFERSEGDPNDLS